MERSQVNRNIKLYYLFRAIREPLFWGPILILYIQEVSGMTLAQIYFMESVVVLGFIALEVPSGALADLVGYRRTVLVGSVVLLVDAILFSVAQSPLIIWSANIAWVIGASLVSGADSALIYDTLQLAGRESEYKKIEGNSHGLRLAMFALGSLASGYMYEAWIRLPLVASTVLMAGNLYVVYLFTEPVRQQYDWRKHAATMWEGLRYTLQTKAILWVVAFTVTVSVVSKVWFFAYNDYFVLVGLPEAKFGVIFFWINVVAAASGFMSSWIVQRVNRVVLIAGLLALLYIPIYVMGTWVAPICVWLVLMQNVVRGVVVPFSRHMLHSLVNSHRATVMSVNAAFNGAGQAAGLGLFASVLAAHGDPGNPMAVPLSLQDLAFATLVASMLLLVSYFMIFRKASS